MPGVGRYTAAAIVSLAFGEPAAALDANARRILARVYAYRRPVSGVRSQEDLAALYHRARGRAAPGAFFQALMDLGQEICLPHTAALRGMPHRRKLRRVQARHPESPAGAFQARSRAAL